MHYIVGLGNPGLEYENSRHNTGRMSVMKLLKDLKIEDLEISKKANALIAEGKIGKEKFTTILPETYMNRSGNSVSYFIKPKNKTSKKGIESLIVVHDDIDLPIGIIKISYNKGTGGHRGLDSIVKALKTKEFVRVRIGISPKTPSGKIKKPDGEQKILDFILGKFKSNELEELKKVFKKVNQAIDCIISEGKDKAMNIYN